MRPARIVLLCSVAAFTLTGFATTAAQGQEAYFKCVRKKHGAYTEAGCATRVGSTGKGKFERESAVGVAYTSGTEHAAKVVLSTPGLEMGGRPATMTCRLGAKATGSITAPNLGEEVITFQACELLEQGIKYCTSPGRPLGAIRTNALEAELVETPPDEIGEELRAKGGVAALLTEFSCGRGIRLRLRGSTVGEIASPEPEHALLTSTVVFAGGLDLEVEFSRDQGVTWLGPLPSELRMIATNRGSRGVKLGVEL
jgi:hypothetical protein